MDFKTFCAVENKIGNLDKTKVYNKGGFKCATDGRIAVRIKSDEPDTDGNFPDLEICFGVPYKKIDPAKITKPTLDVTEHCFECDNGKVYFGWEQCKSCHGDGICKCGCPVEHECGKCGGSGGVYPKSVVCRFCDGKMKGYYEYEFEGYYYKGHYMKIAYQELPNLTVIGVNDGGALRMTFDGGECALMPFIKH
jgi:hypothetical protein